MNTPAKAPAPRPNSEQLAAIIGEIFIKLRPEFQEEGLTNRQIRFVEEYFASGMNACEAARRVGYSQKNQNVLGSIAWATLQNDAVQWAIQRVWDELSKKAGTAAAEVEAEIACLAFSDLTEIVGWDSEGRLEIRPSSELPGDVTAAVKSVKHRRTVQRLKDGGEFERHETEFKLHSKIPALDMLAKRHQLYGDGERRSDVIYVVPLPVKQLTADEWFEQYGKPHAEALDNAPTGREIVVAPTEPVEHESGENGVSEESAES